MKIMLYDMELVFSLTMGDKVIKDMLKHITNDEIAIKGFEITMKQTVDCIPTQEVLKKYSAVLQKHMTTNEMYVIECRFDRYNYINPREVELTEEEIDKLNEKKNL